MRTQAASQCGQFAVVCRRGTLAAPRPTRRRDSGAAQRRRQIASDARGAVIHPPRQPHVSERFGRHREVGDRHPARPLVLGEHQRTRIPWRHVRLQDHREPGAPPGRNRHHVAAAQCYQRIHRRTPPVGPALLCQLPFPLLDPFAQRKVVQEPALGATELVAQLPQRDLVALDAAHQPDHRAVRLELGERPLQQGTRLVGAHPVDEVDRHVVPRPERAAQWIRARGRQARDRTGIHLRLPQHHRMAFDVDTAPSRTPGQLGVLARRELRVRLAVELHQALQHDGARGHIDAERQCLRGEYGSHEPVDEQFLDGMPERRQHARMVRGQPRCSASRHSQ